MFLGSGEDAGKLLAFGASCFRTLKKYGSVVITVGASGDYRVFLLWFILFL